MSEGITSRNDVRGPMAAAAIIGLPQAAWADEPEIVIGNPQSLTGGFGEAGARATWDLLIAADEINRHGGIKALGGAKPRVIPADTSSPNPA